MAIVVKAGKNEVLYTLRRLRWRRHVKQERQQEVYLIFKILGFC